MPEFPHTFTPLIGGWTFGAVHGPMPDGLDVCDIPATVPGLVHTDLLRAGLIPDPFDGENESALHWIGRTTWRYSTRFKWTEDGCTRHDLVALGLDTVAMVELNGVPIARTENQHRSYRFDVRGILREGLNELAITFVAPVPEVERRDVEHGAWPRAYPHAFNQLRKSPFSFGWDWGIDAVSSGIWKPIGIDSWSGVRIASVCPLVGVEGTDGVIAARVEIERDSHDHETVVEVDVCVGSTHQRAIVDAGTAGTCVEVRVPDAELWWPVGHGAQPLYDVTVEVLGTPGAEWQGRVGFRTVELDTSPDESGNRFVLRVNGEAILVRGVNWIPDHAFVTELTRDRYAARFADALEGGVNLLRVWGGGNYESREFYELADENGLLVWQDFLFACAAYSEEPWLATEVEAEAREQIVRLCQHPSLVVWNGNNENTWGYVDWGWRPELAGRPWGDGYYSDLLPRLLAELDPTRPYSPASPFSFVDHAHPNDDRNGTMHIWDVWNDRDYTAYRDYRPRFVSEFGFQGPPAWSTLTRVVHDEPMDASGAQMLVHQKAAGGNDKLTRGMAGHLPTPRRIEDWHWATQLNQAQAIRFGVEYFRSLTPHNTGTILWQLNDDWPVISWAAVDFDGHRKPLWYALRAAYAERLLTIQPVDDGMILAVVNDTADALSSTALMTRESFDGTVLAEYDVPVLVAPRSATRIPIPAGLAATERADAEIVVAAINGCGRTIWNPAEVVQQQLDPDALDVTVERSPDGYAVTITARAFARDIFLAVDRVDAVATVDLGMVSLLAGETVTFMVSSRADVPIDSFADPLVVRSANDLLG